MSRPPTLNLAFTFSLLTLAACGENTEPTQPATAEDRSSLEASLAFASNTWTNRARLPEGGPRGGLAAGVVNNSAGNPILYIFGGFFEDHPNGSIRAYNYSRNTWTTKASGVERQRTNGVGRIGGKLYFSGGYIGGRDGTCCDATRPTLYAYDPAADRLVQKADMPQPTADGVTGVINGKLYVLAGTCSDDSPPFDCSEHGTSRRFYRYDPATNTWTTLPPAPHQHAGGAGGVINGRFYVAGGGSVVRYRLDVYDPVTNIWRARADLPEARSGTAGAVLQNKLYVIGGVGPSGNRAVFAYDPVTNKWQTRASLNAGRSSLAAASLVTIYGNPKILAVGGFDGSDGPGANELYTP
jgi:N-acetylneuraminic acid mutarotase